MEFVRPELVASGVNTELSLSPELPRVMADVGQLRQLLLNLVRNAREAMRGGGHLRVSTRGGEGAVEIQVKDTGPGIPSERLQRIFDPFFTTKERGTGLGLAIVHRIVEAHSGHLSVRSQVGRGTTFRVVLPIAAPSQTQLPAAVG